MKKVFRFLFALSFVALMAGPAVAGVAVDFNSVNTDFTNGNWSLGFEFTTNAPVNVTALGFYDDLKNGLAERHDVGIYDAVGNLLVSTQVTNADPLTSFFRFHNITPLNLPAYQNFYIMAVTGSENYTWGTNGFVVDPSITFGVDMYFSPANGVLTFPNKSDGLTQALGGGWFGPNFMTSAVPLPPSVLLLGPGLLWLIGYRRKFNK